MRHGRRAPWVALVGPEQEENLGVRYVAASLARACIVHRILPFLGDPGRVLDLLASADEPPYLVALALSFQVRAREILALAVELRRRGYAGHITAGGHFASLAWRDLLARLPELDSICRFEAEETLRDLAGALARGAPVSTVAGLALRDGDGSPRLTPPRPPPELACLAWPERSGARREVLRRGVASVVASRGCYARCAFCSIAALHAEQAPWSRQRFRPIDDVADEMEALHREGGIELFVFQDDEFLPPAPEEALARLHGLARELERRGVAGFGTILRLRPSDVSPEVVVALERLRCVRVILGVDSHAEQGLRTLGRGVRPAQNEAATALLGGRGISLSFNMLLFDPDMSFPALAENLAFMERHADVAVAFARAELYEGTPLLDRMRREGRATRDDLTWDYRWPDPRIGAAWELTVASLWERNFAPDGIVQRLQQLQLEIAVSRRFEGGEHDARWERRGADLARDCTRDTVARIRGAVSFAQTDPTEQARAGFAAAAREDVAALDGRLAHHADELETTLRRRARGPGAGAREPSPSAGTKARPGRHGALGSPRERVAARLHDLARRVAAGVAAAAGAVAAAAAQGEGGPAPGYGYGSSTPGYDPPSPPPVEPFIGLVAPGVVAATWAALAARRGRVSWRIPLRIATSVLALLALALAIGAVVTTGRWNPQYRGYPSTCLGGFNCFRLLATGSALVAGVNVVLAWVGRGEPRRGHWALAVAGAALTVTSVVLVTMLVQAVIANPAAIADAPVGLSVAILPALAGVPMSWLGARRLGRRPLLPDGR